MKIPCTIIDALAPCVDTESSRYALEGIHIEDGQQPYAVVTDGRCAIVASWADNGDLGDAGTATLDTADMLDAAARARRHGDNDVGLVGDPVSSEQFIAGQGACTNTVAVLDGRFPKWRDIVPKRKRSVSVSVDAKRLARVARAVGKALDDVERANHSVELLIVIGEDGQADKDTPIVLSGRAPDGRKAMGILMPLTEGDRPEPYGWNQREDEEVATPAEPEGETNAD